MEKMAAQGGRMKKIAFFTYINPSPINAGGEPSGLPWEVIQSLKRQGHTVDLHLVERGHSSRVTGTLHRYGLYLKKIDIDLSPYDFIIAYPESFVGYLPRQYRHKVIALGPDSPSLRDARIYKSASGWKKLYRWICYQWALLHERQLLRDIKKMVVVGRTDALWMKRNPYIAADDREKIVFLRHPILSEVVRAKLDDVKTSTQRRFVFAGFIDERFHRSFIEAIADALDEVGGEVKLQCIVLGKANRWMTEVFRRVRGCDMEYMDWIEDYNEVCMLGQDVHCLPIVTGAGTKNRTLTAIGNGLEVVTTPMGIENIMYKGLKGVYIASSARQFAEKILCLCHSGASNTVSESWIKERMAFRARTTRAYEEKLDEIMRDKAE